MTKLISPKPDAINQSIFQALKNKPDAEEALKSIWTLNNLAWSLATSPDSNDRDGALAVMLAERACEQTHYQKTITIGTLAAAYAEAGRFDDAISAAKKACALATELGETNLLSRNQELMALYQGHEPYHEPPPGP